MRLSAERRELGALIGADLGVVAPALGGVVNPPCVVVGHDSPFIEPITYGGEVVRWVAYVVAGPGEATARLDELEDRVDAVRDALRGKSTSGLKFAFGGVDPPGDVDGLLVCAVHITRERTCA